MGIKQGPEVEMMIPNRRLVLQPPSRVFRFVWLVVGLITGYIIALFPLPGVGLLALLAALTGASANWSS